MKTIPILATLVLLPWISPAGTAIPCENLVDDVPECITERVCLGAWETSESLLLGPVTGFEVFVGSGPSVGSTIAGLSLANGGGGPTEPGSHVAFVVIGVLYSPYVACHNDFSALGTVPEYWIQLESAPQPPG